MAVKKPDMDPAHAETEKLLKELESKIAKEYAQADKEVQAKLDDYMKRFATKDKKWREWVENSKTTEMQKQIKEWNNLVKSGEKTKEQFKAWRVRNGVRTEEEYQQWRTGQMMVGKRWEEMRDTLAQDYHNANMIARSITEGYMPEVYAINHNYGTFEVEKGSLIDTYYTLYDRQTVERLIKDGEVSLLPPPKEGGKTAKRLAENKDLKWNQQKVTSAITQGILQGDNIDKIAKRLEAVTDSNYKAAVRNARTMTTGAQNAGRVDSYKRAQDMGIEMRQTWVATLDSRTRHEHRQLDGQTVDIGEPFEVDGEKIMYPGDPSASPHLVYNCRCTLIGQIKGFERDVKGFDLRNDPDVGGMTYEEWKNDRNSKSNPITLPRDKGEAIAESYRREYRDGVFGGKDQGKYDEQTTVSNGTDIMASWKRREEQFDFPIEDVINAQGFDGNPMVVSPDEFDKYVKNANGGKGFVAQRTYSAPDQETLDAYREQLYNGKWYVDCSTGGAKYGTGMYCAANYEGNLTKEILQEMKDYQGQNVLYSGAKSVHYVETFTLDPSAKVITLDELTELRGKYVRKWQEEYLDSIPYKGRSEEEYYRDLSEGRKKLREINNMYSDNGVFATALGYDAIRTEAGTSGADTIILNRTKVIFKGEQ